MGMKYEFGPYLQADDRMGGPQLTHHNLENPSVLPPNLDQYIAQNYPPVEEKIDTSGQWFADQG